MVSHDVVWDAFASIARDVGFHVLHEHCTHGGERVVSHDVVWDAFASIARDVGFHVLHEQTHIFLLPIC